MVEPADGRVLSGDVCPRLGRVLYEVRHRDVAGRVATRPPVGDRPHARRAVAETLAETAELGVRVRAAVRVVEADVEEKRPAEKREQKRESETPGRKLIASEKRYILYYKFYYYSSAPVNNAIG